MLLLLIVLFGALVAAAYAGRRAGRVTPWQFRLVLGIGLALALLLAAAIAIDRIEAA